MRFVKVVILKTVLTDVDNDDCGSDEGGGGYGTSSGGYFDSNYRNPWMTRYATWGFYFESLLFQKCLLIICVHKV